MLCIVLFITGCATTQEYAPIPGQKPDVKAEAPVKKEGVYHKVKKGQTLYRIAKAYGVVVEDVISANNIPNAAAIEVDQLILIPKAKEEITDIAAPVADDNKDEFAWPLKGKVIRYFNDRKGEGINRGIEIEAQEGDAVKAAREGKVVIADYMAGHGETVMIDHGDGFISVYAGNAKVMVKNGDQALKGDTIALVGRSGNKSSLHFEVRKGTTASNPLYYLP